MGIIDMNEDKSPDFRFRMDEESPDAALQEDLQEGRLGRLSRRVTILAILFPLLIGIALYFAHADIKKTLSQQQSTGSQSVEGISRDLETLFDQLNVRLTDIETNLTTQADTAVKNLDAVKSRVYKTENRIKKLDAAKADKKEQVAAAKGIERVNKQIEALDDVFARKLTDLVTIIDNEKEELVNLRAEITALVVNKLDRNTFDERFEQENLDQQKTLTLLKTELGVLRTDFNKRIAGFERKIKDIDALTKSISTELDKLSKQVNSSPAAPRKAPTVRPPAAAPPNGIIEKDLS